jgi:hypothetical protein
MANNIAFQPMGKTVLLSSTSSSSNVAVTADSPVNQLYISNTGNSDVYLVTGTSTPLASVKPTAGTPQYGFSIPAGTAKVISNLQTGANATIYVAGISANACSIYITPGEGL